jgi:hypothetical protein
METKYLLTPSSICFYWPTYRYFFFNQIWNSIEMNHFHFLC